LQQTQQERNDQEIRETMNLYIENSTDSNSHTTVLCVTFLLKNARAYRIDMSEKCLFLNDECLFMSKYVNLISRQSTYFWQCQKYCLFYSKMSNYVYLISETCWKVSEFI
jgi:hypothetical protein